MSQENLERLRAVYSEFAQGKFGAAEQLLAPDVVYEPMSDGREAYLGREAVAEHMGGFLAQWREFRIEAQEFVEVGEAVVVSERQYGKGRSSGIETEMTFYAVWTFCDGLVVRARWESDLADALKAAERTE